MKDYEQPTLQPEMEAQTEVTSSEKKRQAQAGSISRRLSIRRLVQKHTDREQRCLDVRSHSIDKQSPASIAKARCTVRPHPL